MREFDPQPRFDRMFMVFQAPRIGHPQVAVHPDGPRLIKGILFGLALVTPFWILVGYAISSMAH